MEPIFDSHAHYHDARFDDDRDDLLSRLPESGIVGVVNCGTDVKTAYESLALSAKYPFVYTACGIHAHDAAAAREGDLDTIRRLLSEERCVAVGEIGLDYHYNFSPRDVQLALFERQLLLARETGLPVIVHDREAHEDTLRLLQAYRVPGVVHCFSGSAEMAKELVKLGMYIGFGGAVTFRGAKKPLAAAAVVPDDRLLLETDCPYMSPVPYRGRRCDSTMVPLAAAALAAGRGCTIQALLQTTADNARKLFAV